MKNIGWEDGVFLSGLIGISAALEVKLMLHDLFGGVILAPFMVAIVSKAWKTFFRG